MLILVACSTTSVSELSRWEIPDTEFPLAEPGPYYPGYQEHTIVDENRGGREIELTIWYPANEETNALNMHDAPVNKRDAPFPLILTGNATGGELFDDHLVTHGFVMVEVTHPDDYISWDYGLIDHPRDFLFALDQLAANPPEGVKGIIDTDHVGVAGFSWEGYYSLAVSGVRINPEFYLEQCLGASSLDPPLSDRLITYYCDLAARWDDFEAQAGSQMMVSEDGLWRPLTDERIRAVIPMAPEGAWLFGKRGLAAGDRPTMIITGTADDINKYGLETVFIFENLGTPDRVLVSFVDETHSMADMPEPRKRMQHFVTAFFGYYLQEFEDYAEFYSEDFVTQFDDLAWGVYEN